MVGTRDRPQRPVHHTSAVRANIGALIVKEFVFETQNAAFRIDGKTRAMALLP